MLANFIWFSAIALEALILLRGSTTGLLKKYPLFYSYIGCVLLKEIIGLITNELLPNYMNRCTGHRARHHSGQLRGNH